ncbi:hypothetical protein MPTK1_7g16110 [Marchantia polymorpha subsp. ruderalis]|uniref:Uncharacterized protein n=2 Tax=Marchantia polymorpha TaxID=3197 RepID=A0AAF6C072_MARPO|nr:hypothetical protein MARPO_0111s0009 [Marchantia polymorpha]BBN17656.1 hypothetical protein Mp_7g16110 [Marchantia polymorpha subsp. ruderalis]|eukprot:PTQ31448.1 hypothetical protein MARPO_0111s0009 [Marchantia polymorpha]
MFALSGRVELDAAQKGNFKWSWGEVFERNLARKEGRGDVFTSGIVERVSCLTDARFSQGDMSATDVALRERRLQVDANFATREAVGASDGRHIWVRTKARTVPPLRADCGRRHSHSSEVVFWHRRQNQIEWRYSSNPREYGCYETR